MNREWFLTLRSLFRGNEVVGFDSAIEMTNQWIEELDDLIRDAKQVRRDLANTRSHLQGIKHANDNLNKRFSDQGGDA